MVAKSEDAAQKKYELLIDNQVEFIKSDLMKGQEPKVKKEKKHESDESMDEADF